jgi:hypothetical protein
MKDLSKLIFSAARIGRRITFFAGRAAWGRDLLNEGHWFSRAINILLLDGFSR